MHRPPGNDLDLGQITGRGKPLIFPRDLRDKHLYICGSTGTGKSKFLEHLIWQDIRKWRQSKCGLILFDPHGSLYDSLMRRLAWEGIDRPVIPIDLRQDEWVIPYNMLRQRRKADPAVVISNFVQAMAYVWGESGTERTPLFARWASNILGILSEMEWTLLDAERLTSRVDKRTRRAVIEVLTNRSAAKELEFLNELNAFQVESQIGSTINRLYKFTNTRAMQQTFGQSHGSLDLGTALEEGHIILVNLSTEGGRIDEEDASLFATLLLSDLWTTAKERGKGTDNKPVKPFYVYIDEFQNFVTPTIAKNLDQARGFGLHLTLAHQFPRQLMHAGAHGAQVYDSVMVNARSKVIFQIEGEENLRPLAQSLFMGTMSPDKIKHELYSTKVMGYREEYRTSYSQSKGRGQGQSESSGNASGEGEGGTESYSYENFENGDDPSSVSRSKHAFMSGSSNSGKSYSESESESETDSPMLIPIMGKELASVQFESLEEQLFRAMAVLFDQEQRQGVARLVGMKAPVSFHTPTVRTSLSSKEIMDAYVNKLMSNIPYALTGAEAQRRVEDRKVNFAEDLLRGAVQNEPATAKRKLKGP